MNSDFPQSPREELEARITALLLGELTEAEAELLRRRIAEEPELARLQDQLKRTIGLVREATGSPEHEVAQSEAPKLSAERREILLKTFQAKRPKQFKPKRQWNTQWREVAALAAMIIGLMVIGSGFLWYRRGRQFSEEAFSGARTDALAFDAERLSEDTLTLTVSPAEKPVHSGDAFGIEAKASGGAGTTPSRPTLALGAPVIISGSMQPIPSEAAQQASDLGTAISTTEALGVDSTYATIAGGNAMTIPTPLPASESSTFYDPNPKPLATRRPEIAKRSGAQGPALGFDLSGESAYSPNIEAGDALQQPPAATVARPVNTPPAGTRIALPSVAQSESDKPADGNYRFLFGNRGLDRSTSERGEKLALNESTVLQDSLKDWSAKPQVEDLLVEGKQVGKEKSYITGSYSSPDPSRGDSVGKDAKPEEQTIALDKRAGGSGSLGDALMTKDPAYFGVLSSPTPTSSPAKPSDNSWAVRDQDSDRPAGATDRESNLAFTSKTSEVGDVAKVTRRLEFGLTTNATHSAAGEKLLSEIDAKSQLGLNSDSSFDDSSFDANRSGFGAGGFGGGGGLGASHNRPAFSDRLRSTVNRTAPASEGVVGTDEIQTSRESSIADAKGVGADTGKMWQVSNADGIDLYDSGVKPSPEGTKGYYNGRVEIALPTPGRDEKREKQKEAGTVVLNEIMSNPAPTEEFAAVSDGEKKQLSANVQSQARELDRASELGHYSVGGAMTAPAQPQQGNKKDQLRAGKPIDNFGQSTSGADSVEVAALGRELEQARVIRERVRTRIEQETIDAHLPKSGIVEVINPAEAQPNEKPSVWQRLRGKLTGEVERSARLKVQPDARDVAGIGERYGASSFDPYSVQRESEMIVSKPVLANVVTNLGLAEAWGEKQGKEKLTTDEAVQRLKKMIDVQPDPKTSLMEIRARSDNAEEAARIANEVVTVYKHSRVAQRLEMTLGGIGKLEEDFAKHDQKVAQLEQQLEQKKKELNLEQKDVSTAKPVVTAAIPQPEIQSAENPFSTFSLNVSDVSFKLAGASLEKGQIPEAASVRSEEFINAFDYRDPEPAGSARVAFNWDRARYPFAHNRDILRFSVKTAAIGRQAGRPLNLVLLLDNSGSMERADRVRIIQECLRVLAKQLTAQDRVSVVAFSRTARLWVDGLPGNQAGELPDRVGGLTPQGGTNLEDAMNVAYQTALRHYLTNGVNRVVLLTDGAANLGDVEPESLKKKVEANRLQGIALDCFGIGWEGYNDDLLETLSRNGDGRYGFVNTPEAAASEFAGQLAGALKVAASDVKVQVEFNPKRVTTYRQIGYAKHQLKKEQFRDNAVDAAEIGAAEAGNALYVVQVNPHGEGPLATVRVRYKVPGTSDYREHEWAVPYAGPAKLLEQSSVAMRLATIASAFSEWLASSPYAGEVAPGELLNYLAGVPETCNADPRPKKLEWMIRQAKSISGR